MKRLIAVLALVVAGCGGTEEEQQGAECYDYEVGFESWGRYCVPDDFTRTEFCWQTNEPCRQSNDEPDEETGEVMKCMTIREDGRGTIGDVFAHCGGDADCYPPDVSVNDEPCCTVPDEQAAMCD